MPERDWREPADKTREQRLRRWARRFGWRIERSRARRLHSNDYGLYQLIDDSNTVVAGASYDADLDTIEACLEAEERFLLGDPEEVARREASRKAHCEMLEEQRRREAEMWPRMREELERMFKTES